MDAGCLYAKKRGLDLYSTPPTPIYFICVALCTDVNSYSNLTGFSFAVGIKDV
jgi:hypothetical protein